MAVFSLALFTCACAAAQAVSRGYTINTQDMTCEEANRYVQASLGDMNMTITEFRKARAGEPGFAKARRKADRDGLSGRVDIRCDDEGVHIVPNESGFATARDFERGLFLSVTGRADLVVEREGRYSTGILHKRSRERLPVGQLAGSETPKSDRSHPDMPSPAGGVEVQIELVRGFATVLDFEANVSAAGILPVKVTVANKTARRYDFDPRHLALRKSGSREVAEPLTAAEAVQRLRARAEGSDGSGTARGDLGDVAAATRIIPEREIEATRLQPGRSISGFMYFPDGEYDRARVTMTDVATGETEGFVVEF